jgi:hypothetical protein
MNCSHFISNEFMILAKTPSMVGAEGSGLLDPLEVGCLAAKRECSWDKEVVGRVLSVLMPQPKEYSLGATDSARRSTHR